MYGILILIIVFLAHKYHAQRQRAKWQLRQLQLLFDNQQAAIDAIVIQIAQIRQSGALRHDLYEVRKLLNQAHRDSIRHFRNIVKEAN